MYFVPLCVRIKNVYLQDTVCNKVLLSSKSLSSPYRMCILRNFLWAPDDHNRKRAKESLVLCLPWKNMYLNAFLPKLQNTFDQNKINLYLLNVARHSIEYRCIEINLYISLYIRFHLSLICWYHISKDFSACNYTPSLC